MANLEFKRALNFMGFVATMLIAAALIVSIVVSLINGDGAYNIPNFPINNVESAFSFFANILAYFITIVAGFYYVKSKRNVWFMVAQIVGTLIILTAVILGAVL